MSYQVTVAAGLKNVVLPDGLRHRAGDVVTLTDDQYAQLSAPALSSLLKVTPLNAVNALDYGADPTGTSDSTAAIQAAVNALPSGGGRYSNGRTAQGGGIVHLPAGTYLVSSTITVNSGAVTLLGDGRWSTYLKYTGTGDCCRMIGPVVNTQMGGIKQLMIDGTSATAPATGLHIGDGIQYELDIAIQNFTGAGSIGLHLDNTQWWTEQLHGTVRTDNCTSHVVFDVNGNGYNSFARTDLTAYVGANAAQDGVVIQNGAVVYDGSLAVRGNFASSSTTPMSNAVLRVTGQGSAAMPNNPATGFSSIKYNRLEIGVETPTNTFTPQTINFGTGSNIIVGYGFLDFSTNGSPFTMSNYAHSANQFTFAGPVGGDKNIVGASVNVYVAAGNTGSVTYATAGLTPSSGNFFISSGDFFNATLVGNMTVIFQGGINAPQRKTVFITQAASGGPFTVTWPKPGSPNTGSPAVYWPGGTAPVMSTAAGAIDKYVLETLDGIRWYGTAFQALS